MHTLDTHAQTHLQLLHFDNLIEIHREKILCDCSHHNNNKAYVIYVCKGEWLNWNMMRLLHVELR